jgi:hypothetical protein
VGKLSLLVALAWGVIQITSWMLPNGPRLEAKCVELDVPMAPDLKDVLDAEYQFPDRQSLLAAFATSLDTLGTNLNITSQTVSKVASGMESALKAAKLANPDFTYNGWQHFSILTIENKGNKPADQLIVALDKDYGGIATIEYDGRVKRENVFGSIDLGSVRAGGKITINIWSTVSLLPYGHEAIVSYSEGTIPIQTSTSLYGYGAEWGAIINFSIEHPIIFLIEISLIGFICIKIFSYVDRYFPKDSPQPESKKVEISPKNTPN